MIWLTWRQFRTSVVLAGAALAAIGIVLDVTAANHTVAGGYLTHDHLVQFLSTALIAVPALIGAFWGAPLVARELETGTYRLAWAQSVTRARWLAIRVALMSLISVAATGALTLMLTLWSSRATDLDRFSSAMFSERGIAPMGYAAFAFALGVTAGVVLRRTVPAMATTLIVFLAVRVVVAYLVRPHFATAVTRSAHLPQGIGPGLLAQPGDWVLSDHLVSATRHVTNSATCGVRVTSGSPPSPASLHAIAQHCLAQYRAVLTYQPADRYWAFQAYETATFVALALILTGLSFWWIRHRLA